MTIGRPFALLRVSAASGTRNRHDRRGRQRHSRGMLCSETENETSRYAIRRIKRPRIGKPPPANFRPLANVSRFILHRHEAVQDTLIEHLSQFAGLLQLCAAEQVKSKYHLSETGDRAVLVKLNHKYGLAVS